MTEINQIVNQSYKLFSGGRLNKKLDACSENCCLSEKNVVRLKTVPLKNISLELLAEYQNAATPSTLNINELKYFTPKYLELLANFQYPSIDPTLSLTRFGYFKRSDWTNEEWMLLNNFAKLYFKRHLNLDINQPSCTSTAEALLMFYKGNFEVNSLLKEWEKQSSDESIFSFFELLNDIDFQNIKKPKIKDPFSDEKFDLIICNWIFSSNVKLKFRNEFHKALAESNIFWSKVDKESLKKNYNLIK